MLHSSDYSESSLGRSPPLHEMRKGQVATTRTMVRMISTQWYLWEVKVPKRHGTSPSQQCPSASCNAAPSVRLSISISRTMAQMSLRRRALLACTIYWLFAFAESFRVSIPLGSGEYLG